MIVPAAVGFLRTYTKLQSKLCLHLTQEHNFKSDWVRSDFPKRGGFSLENEAWSYQIHGAGARLTRNSDKCVVEAHDCFVTRPAVLDTWRVLCYCESLCISKLQYGNIDCDVSSEATIEALLALLAAKSVLVRVSDSPPRYEFPPNYLMHWLLGWRLPRWLS